MILRNTTTYSDRVHREVHLLDLLMLGLLEQGQQQTGSRVAAC